MFDVPQTNIRKYFNTSCQYIETALQNKGNYLSYCMIIGEYSAILIHNLLPSSGRVLVHCLMGMSRSSTLVLAFMMKVMNMTAVDATREVRSMI